VSHPVTFARSFDTICPICGPRPMLGVVHNRPTRTQHILYIPHNEPTGIALPRAGLTTPGRRLFTGNREAVFNFLAHYRAIPGGVGPTRPWTWGNVDRSTFPSRMAGRKENRRSQRSQRNR
jgi:hypothetical protein